ncbi:hypothetical protein AX15_007939 [Amanita polypyramis BW_CC]|nr:hypothetical protein AX15_007939 [Amanita polypyramis BW_CC]
MSAHTAYYQVAPYTQQQVAIPQGWQPPYQGAPPMPSGINVNPQLWQAGRWQLNPAYFAQHQGRPSQPNQHTWAAAQTWQQPRPQESKNPYKRTPKPPSAEYLATRLSDNPLGLTDMIPAEELYAQQQANETANDLRGTSGTAAVSPWIWNPPSLEPDDDDSTEPSIHDSGRPRTPPRPSASSVQQNLSTPQGPENRKEQKEEDPYTARRELVPTFSVNIVRTPEHYKSSPSRSSSRSSYNSRSSRSSTDPQHLVSKMEGLSTADFPNPPSRQASVINSNNSLQPSTISGVPNLVDEPTPNLLSPLLLTTSKPNNRPLGRHSTFPLVNGPSSLNTIPEASTVSRSDQQSNLRTRKSSNRNLTRCKTDPADAYHHNHSPSYPIPSSTSPYFKPSPSRSPYTSGSSRGSSQQPSPATSLSLSPHDHYNSPPTSGSSRHSNPLPAPPAEHPNIPFSLSSSGSAQPTKRVRKGYWNKRGDHCTKSGYIVYAPHDQTYPFELQDYPDESVGYLDENSHFLKFHQRPEHPESLPHYGQPPLRPYSSFVDYV